MADTAPLLRASSSGASAGRGGGSGLRGALRMPPRSLRRRVWDTLSTKATKFKHASTHWPSRVFEIFIASLIIVNVVLAIWDAEASSGESVVDEDFLEAFGVLSTVVFTVEYAARLWACVEVHEYASSWSGRLRWALKPLSLIDLVALLTFYLDYVVLGEATQTQRGLKALRLLRVVSFLRLERQSKAFKRLSHVLGRKKEELLVALFAGAVMLIVASVLMYYVEHESNGEVFSSLSETLYWGVATMTSVGSALTPVTPAGKVVLSVLSILGVGVIAIPAGIISAGFVQTMMDEDSLEAMKAQNEALQAAAIIAAERRLTRGPAATAAAEAVEAVNGGAGGARAAGGGDAPVAGAATSAPRLAASPQPHALPPLALYAREASASSLTREASSSSMTMDAGDAASSWGGGGRSRRARARESTAAPAHSRTRARSLHIDSVGSVRMLSVGGDGLDGAEPVLVPSLTMQCPHCRGHVHVSVGLA